MKTFIMGIDLGQLADYSAVGILEKIEMDENSKKFSIYHLRHIQRFELHTPYPAITHQIKEMRNRLEPADVFLAVDATGVGMPVVDMMEREGLYGGLFPITIHGGDAVSNEGNHYKVPKRDLISNLQIMFQTKKLIMASSLPEIQTLIRELENFRVKINISGHDSYEAWREGIHDDLVLAVSLAAWAGENCAYAPSIRFF